MDISSPPFWPLCEDLKTKTAIPRTALLIRAELISGRSFCFPKGLIDSWLTLFRASSAEAIKSLWFPIELLPSSSTLGQTFRNLKIRQGAFWLEKGRGNSTKDNGLLSERSLIIAIQSSFRTFLDASRRVSHRLFDNGLPSTMVSLPSP